MVQTAADIEREVREADAGRVKALLESDLAALEALLGDDLTYVHSSGALDTKTSYIESISSGRARYLAMDM
ncbi:MAG TPA: nuclear transport factor 2 family protein, partial [Dehalococcoidia bacterium]|nr:nuclear transport factor 2 family protein [Dehalococcoidia bacterium]